MKYISILLLLLALSFGVFGCEPERKSDAPVAEEFTADAVVEQPVVEIEPEPEPVPEPAVIEPQAEVLTVDNEKPVEEIAVVIADETDSEPDEVVADDKAEDPEAAEEDTTVEKTETVVEKTETDEVE
ncbi:MAG: hypothetical protein K9M75_01085, partial [Phycisphaerae bacterium]|nr:hypothetical protein [Phycisphaerae bacterium]